MISSETKRSGFRVQFIRALALFFFAIFYVFGSALLSAAFVVLVGADYPRNDGWEECYDCLNLVWAWPYDAVALSIAAVFPALFLMRKYGLRRGILRGMLITALGIGIHISIIFKNMVEQFQLVESTFFESFMVHMRATWNEILSPFSRHIPLFWLLALLILPAVMLVIDAVPRVRRFKAASARA